MSKTYILGQGWVVHRLVPWKDVKTMQQFYDRMKSYDWTTSCSDDNRVYNRGQYEWEHNFEPCLQRMKKIHGEKAQKLFEEMRSWAWNEGELPERPE